MPELASTTRARLRDERLPPNETRATAPTLINIWAGWCGPCVDELPLLQRVAERGEVRIVGVSRDVREAVARDSLRTAGVTYANWFDPDGQFTRAAQSVIPANGVPATALVVDEQIVAVHLGPFESMKDVAAYRRFD
ncbi:TlpA family protein disulfide reductase [Nocardioides aurantiacus]|uniref:TlpA family protein disulfide reductase n=1 Tax=Nocardioides aurantiacus TaxID=86796 RepID=UPI00147747EE|nr:TlpA disulfide reductase family protein [Nocardioides aurantiacus]